MLCMSPHPCTWHIMGGGSADSPHQVLSRPQAGPQQVGAAAVAAPHLEASLILQHGNLRDWLCIPEYLYWKCRACMRSVLATEGQVL